jgi:hypothetical protein
MKPSIGHWAITLTLLFTMGIMAQEIIIEANGPRSQDGEFRIHSGDWSQSTGESSVPGLTRDTGSRFCNGGRSGTAAFLPEITQSGDYEIFVTWCTSGNSTDVLYTINHEDGQSRVTLTQDGWGRTGASNANQWISLGTYPLSVGESGGVAVTSQPGASPPSPSSMHRVYADAVRFVRRGGSPASASRGSSAASVTPVASRGPAPRVSARDLIIEVNIPSSAGTFRTLDGNWNTSVGKSLAEGLTHDEGTLFMPLGRPGSAVFEFNIPASGTYDVYTTWCTSGNSTDALYTIRHADGQSQVMLTQDGWGGRGSSNANDWVRLGTHRFERSDSASVTVTSQEGSTPPDDRNSHRVYADGMRLVPRDTGGTMIASSTRTPSTTSSRRTTPAPVQVVVPRTTPRATPVGESSLISWRYSHDIARAESRSDGKPLVIYAYTERSRTCRENEATLLRDPGVVANLSDTVPLRINLSENTDLAPVLRVYRVPTFIVVDAGGREVGRHLGPITSEELIDLINGH